MEEYVRELGKLLVDIELIKYAFLNVIKEKEYAEILPDCEGNERRVQEIKILTNSCNSIHTLSKSVCFRKSNISGNGCGIWSNMKIPKGVRFGPYQGLAIYDEDEADHSGFCWQILKYQNVDHFVDGTNEKEPNWLCYVNFSPYREQQNLIVQCCGGRIYYETITDILPDTELLVWVEDNWNDRGKDSDRNDSTAISICHNKEFGNHSNSQNNHTPEINRKHFVCDLCEKTFAKRCILNGHMRTHTGEKPHICDFCGRSFARKVNLKVHTRIHTGEKPYTCHTCGKSFAQNGNLEFHMHVHTGEKPYTCDLCGKTFSTNNCLKRHNYVHTGRKKPYACDLCEKRFITDSQFKKHQHIHIGEKPYLCNLCGMKFSENSELKFHVCKDIGERPYICDLCGKRYKRMDNLKFHRRKHVIEKSFVCNLCRKKFATSYGLKLHQEIHNKEETHILI